MTRRIFLHFSYFFTIFFCVGFTGINYEIGNEIDNTEHYEMHQKNLHKDIFIHFLRENTFYKALMHRNNSFLFYSRFATIVF